MYKRVSLPFLLFLSQVLFSSILSLSGNEHMFLMLAAQKYTSEFEAYPLLASIGIHLHISSMLAHCLSLSL